MWPSFINEKVEARLGFYDPKWLGGGNGGEILNSAIIIYAYENDFYVY